jgi:hypothetical protein
MRDQVNFSNHIFIDIALFIVITMLFAQYDKKIIPLRNDIW